MVWFKKEKKIIVLGAVTVDNWRISRAESWGFPLWVATWSDCSIARHFSSGRALIGLRWQVPRPLVLWRQTPQSTETATQQAKHHKHLEMTKRHKENLPCRKTVLNGTGVWPENPFFLICRTTLSTPSVRSQGRKWLKWQITSQERNRFCLYKDILLKFFFHASSLQKSPDRTGHTEI